MLNLQDIEFPIKLNQIKNIEHFNDISINIYYIEKKKKKLEILPIWLADIKKNKHVNLLYVQDNNVEHVDQKPVSWVHNSVKTRKYFCDRYVFLEILHNHFLSSL